MKHPTLESVSDSFRAIAERKFSASEESNVERTTSKAVYVFQREYATVDPAHVDVRLYISFYKYSLLCACGNVCLYIGFTIQSLLVERKR